MDFNLNDTRKTERNRSTRMKIGKTIVELLDRTPLAEIKISTISKLTKLSRMTFYHYYDSKEAALKDYLLECIYLFKKKSAAAGMDTVFGNPEHIAFAIEYFGQFDNLILKLESIGCYQYIVDCVNDFFEQEYLSFFNNSVYDMYLYSGGLLNVFIRWLHDGKKESPEEFAKIILKNLNR